jgi:nucleoside phosphorylase
MRRQIVGGAMGLALFVAAVCTATAHAVAPARGTPAPSSCQPRTLVLSAMPIELGPLLAQEHVSRTVTVDGRDFYLGRLRGHDVILGLTGIGPVNARRTTRAALAAFACKTRPGIDAIVFSGVAGGDFIGDVTVPARWTLDGGKHFSQVDAHLLAAARRLTHSRLRLERKAPAGDPACACATGPDLVTTVSVTHQPRLEVGGAGETTDPFSGRALPCVPGGGDVFGCEPCALQLKPTDVTSFPGGAAPFVDPGFFTGYFSSTSGGAGKYVAEDEETAAVAAVATARHLPFIGFRAVSDGGGDPLRLPGFPAQFFFYRQLAADNAALVTLEFLATT